MENITISIDLNFYRFTMMKYLQSVSFYYITVLHDKKKHNYNIYL